MSKVDAGLGFEAAGSSGRRALAVVAVALASSVACRESLTQADSGVVASALRPALKIAQPLPGLPDIVAGTPPSPGTTELLARWEDSWNRGVAAGGLLREETYLAAGSLGLGSDSVTARSAIEGVRAAVAEVRSHGLPLSPHLNGALREAEHAVEKADRAGADGDWSVAGLKALRAADALRETSPRAVALTLVEAAEEVLGPPPGADDEEAADSARARRLVWWSRVAINAGGHELALQRAYYACLLLGVELP